MPGHAVRQQFLKEFRNLGTYSRRMSVVIIASYISQVLVAIAVGFWLLQPPIPLPTTVAAGILVLFIGTRLRGFNNIVHECSHFSFSERREDNVLFGRICASLVLGSFADYRDEHMTHHAHLGDYEKDLDLQGIRAFRLEEPLTPRTLLRHVLTPLLGLHLPYYLGANFSARDGAAFRALKIGQLAAATALLVLAPLPALLFVWVPYVWVYTAINYWTDCVDHAGIVAYDDELEASRNFVVPRHLRVFLFPRNDCYHLVHHLFPQVPARHYEACHRRLLAHPEYRACTVGQRTCEPVADRHAVRA